MILAINTSTPQFGVATLREDGTLVTECAVGLRQKNFQGFMPVVDFIINSFRGSPSDIKGIAVATGPGSFTGLRVGLAAAKGIAQGLEVPVVGVPSLEALASRIPESRHPVCPLIDSRKGEVFFGLFRRESEAGLTRLQEDTCARETDLAGLFDSPCLFLGNDYGRQASLVQALLGDKAITAPPLFWHLSASAVGAVGLGRLLRGERDHLRDLVPVYYRPPDIRPGPFQRPRGEGDPRLAS